MTNEEVIEILQDLLDSSSVQIYNIEKAAIMLGIEALKPHDDIKNQRQPIYYAPLPGETDD